MVKRGLGRGLEALLPPDEGQGPGLKEVRYVAINKIIAGRHQPRRNFDPEKLEELARSIKSHGVIQPIVVRPAGNDRYELIAGERRWRACQLAGLEEIPAIIKELEAKESAEVALIENLQREDLNPLEEAEAYRSLLEEYNLTQEEVAARVGKSRPVIANALRLLQLPEEIQIMLRNNQITTGHAKVILSLKEKEAQLTLARAIKEKGLTVREAEKQVQQKQKHGREKVKGNHIEWEWQEIEEMLQRVFTTRVKIKPGKNNSRIEIYYFNQEDLERILAALLKDNVPHGTS